MAATRLPLWPMLPASVLTVLFYSLSLSLVFPAATLRADPPGLAYVFPAGGQRGTQVKLRIGGYYLHERCRWEVNTPEVMTSPELVRTDRLWFEGPLIRQPASQQKEDYPQDYLAEVQIAADAPIGPRLVRAHNAQGITGPLKFIVGTLPEVVEAEMDGAAMPVLVTLPTTINGRIFPREDVDAWKFVARQGESITCSVSAAEIGSPLEAQLEVRDTRGKLIAETSGGMRTDPLLRFKAPETGEYVVRISDVGAGGLQHYVYRLTLTAGPWIDRVYPLGGQRGTEVTFSLAGQQVPEQLAVRLPNVAAGVARNDLTIDGQATNGALLDIDEWNEVLEPTSGERPQVALGTVANGRIAAPGERDVWSLAATKEQPVVIELRAARLGSPLDGVIVVKDASGRELAQDDDQGETNADPRLLFQPPADGVYHIEVRDKFASRGGPAFAYRLRVTADQADFQLSVASDTLAVDVGTNKKLAINVRRLGKFAAPIKLSAVGLPGGISCEEVTIPANQNRGELTLAVHATVPVLLAKVTIIGRAEQAGQSLERRATFVTASGEPSHELLLASTLPTPFRFRGDYEFKYVARGGALTKRYTIERNGFIGPLEVSLADRQGRHLQGISGPTIVVPPEANEFTYTVQLPPWMELGRTSRTNLMLSGLVYDAEGQGHKVCFSTTEQNEQLIALVSPAPLRLSLDKPAMVAVPGSELIVPVRIHRDRSLVGPIQLELVAPTHLKEVAAAPVTVAEGTTSADLRLALGAGAGPFNAPLILRATGSYRDQPMRAEVELELIAK